MELEMEWLEEFVRIAYPVEQGWVSNGSLTIDGTVVPFTFTNDTTCVLIPSAAIEPYLTSETVLKVQSLREKYLSMNSDGVVQVLIFFGKLLVRPSQVPNGVLLFEREPLKNHNAPIRFN